MKPPVMFCAVFLLLAGLLGCGGSAAQWNIEVENTGTGPCSVEVTTSQTSANAKGVGSAQATLTPGSKSPLLSGNFAQTLDSVRVVRGTAEQKIEPKIELKPGTKVRITVPAEGEPTIEAK